MKQATLDAAFAALQTEIKNGTEYPDAIWKISQRFKVDHEIIEAMYDNL